MRDITKRRASWSRYGRSEKGRVSRRRYERSQKGGFRRERNRAIQFLRTYRPAPITEHNIHVVLWNQECCRRVRGLGPALLGGKMPLGIAQGLVRRGTRTEKDFWKNLMGATSDWLQEMIQGSPRYETTREFERERQRRWGGPINLTLRVKCHGKTT